MKKGENNMKKLMILAAVAAMAIGAQADSYTFNLTITGLPMAFTQLTDNGALYLLDKNSQVVYAYTKMEGFNNGVKEGNKLTYQPATELHEAGSVTLDGKTFTVKAHTLNPGTQVDQQNAEGGLTKNVLFQVNFTADGEFFTEHFTKFATVGGQEYYSSDLVAVLSDSGNGYEQGGYYHEFDVGAISSSGGTNPLLSAGDAYPAPEPTSAMLLLLGFAGLALKRKQVA